MDSLAFLKSSAAIGPLYVLPGDEAFLKRQVVRAVKSRALGADTDQAVSTYTGETAAFADVFDELQTLPFFAKRRIVVVEAADPFVTKYRPQLEKIVDKLPASGVLILDVKTWPANTRLAKMVDSAATIACVAPKDYKLAPWCSEWAAAQYQKQFAGPAAGLLVDLVGNDMGLLDQEILKLAIYVGERKKIEATDVDRLVGNNREESTWKIFDALAANQAPAALAVLDRALEQGEAPLKIMGAFGWQLRRLAQAARLASLGTNLRDAVSQVGLRPAAEQQLRHLGRERARHLYDWLVTVNMDLRGGSPLPERTIMERFLLKLAQPSASKTRA
jgi:DNA polymerase III subunit delta